MESKGEVKENRKMEKGIRMEMFECLYSKEKMMYTLGRNWKKKKM